MILDDDVEVVTAARATIERDGADALMVDDLRADDIARLGWSGSRLHVANVAHQLSRPPTEVDYLVVRAPNGTPVAKGGVDYTLESDAGTVWQLATHPDLRSLGLGTRLIAEAERRILKRGHVWSVLGVEDDNTRARALYERLGYVAFRRDAASWDQQDRHGVVTRYETQLAVLRKSLA